MSMIVKLFLLGAGGGGGGVGGKSSSRIVAPSHFTFHTYN